MVLPATMATTTKEKLGALIRCVDPLKRVQNKTWTKLSQIETEAAARHKVTTQRLIKQLKMRMEASL